MQEHYRRSKSCIRFAKGDSPVTFVQDSMVLPQQDSRIAPQAPSQIAPSLKAPQPSTKDIGFLDPSLQHDFPDLCLFHDAHVFCDRIERCRSKSGFLGADILALLPKCLRGEALTWFRSQSECQDLTACLLAMKAKFLPQASSQEAPQESRQIACQALEYHHCKLCNASFSSTARLMRHTQEDVCNKPSCRHCEKVFSSKNQLHIHLREECSKQMHRQSSSKSSSKSLSRSSSRSSSTWPSQSSTACSSTCSPKFSPAPSPAPSPPPRYRAISPSPPSYLTVADLYTRYARPPYLNIDDLFRMFGRRSARSSTIPTTPAAPKHSIRHRGRCQAKKGDGMPKHLEPSKTTKTKQQQNQKQKIGFARTSLQPTPYKSVLSLQRSRSMSCLVTASGSPSSNTRATPQSSTPQCIRS